MKKTLIIIILLISAICSFSQVRPPVEANTLNALTNFIWQSDLIQKDSLAYIKFSGGGALGIKRLHNGTWTYYPIDPSSSNELDFFFHQYKNKWLGDNDTIYTDSLFFKFDSIPEKFVFTKFRDSLQWIQIDSLLTDTTWVKDANGIHHTDKQVGIGINSTDWVKFQVYVNDGIKKAIYGYSAGSYGVYGKSGNSVGAFGEGVTAGVSGMSVNGHGVSGSTDTGYSGYFNGGKGVWIRDTLTVDDQTNTSKLKVGAGSTISRTGTMATYDIWTGTQAEWTANTPKDGVYPQSSTTFWTIKD